MNNKKRYSGIIPPLVTPLTEDEKLDVPALHRLVEHCIEGGVSGLFVNGTSGEAMRLTEAVWEENTRETLKAAAGRVPVFCGAIDANATRAIEKVKRIEAMGGAVAVCTPGFYLTNFGQDEILRHYDRICNVIKIELAIYNIPETTQANILPETVAQLADYDNVTVYKDSTADWQQFQRTLFLCEGKDMAILNGAEELCAATMLFGADGCIPGLANFMPQPFVQLHEACREQRVGECYELQKHIYEVRKSLFVNGCWISAMKYLLELFGLGGDAASSAISRFDARQKEAVREILVRNGVQPP